jgi:arabinofuranosyltransferase
MTRMTEMRPASFRRVDGREAGKAVRQRWLWRAVGAATALLCAVVLGYHALRVYPTFFFDDAFISLRYADRLLHGQGLTWTAGPPVEGYSNFLWVVLVAGIGSVVHNLVAAARVLGLASGALAVAALVWTYAPRRPREIVAPLYGGLVLALSGPIAAWCVGGLEAPLLIALVCWPLALLLWALEHDEFGWRRMALPGSLLGLACLTRPDAPLFVVTLGGGLILADGFRRRAWVGATRLAVIPALCVVAHVAFRRLYYHAWLPNTSTKLVTSLAHVRLGLKYVTGAWQLRFGLLYPAVFTLALTVFSKDVRRRVALILPPLVAWLAYIVAIGGDFMPQYRQLVPALALLAFLSTEALWWMVRRVDGAVATAWVWGPALALHLGIAQQQDPAVPDANNSGWYWDGKPIAYFFRAAFGKKDPLLAVDAAGSLPFFSKLRALDMLGLNDRYIAQHPPKNLGREAVAHGLGNGRYVLSRKPDLVVFHLPFGRVHGLFTSGRQMDGTREFHRMYRLVHYRTHRFGVVDGMVWIRQEDGPLGIQRSSRRIVVPGYLLATSKRTPAELDRKGRVGAVISAAAPAKLGGLHVPAGFWTLKPTASGAVYADVLAAGMFQPRRGMGSVSFRVPAGSRQAVSITVGLAWGSSAHLRSLVLTEDVSPGIIGR